MIFRRRIYLDYASLTPIDPRVSHEMGKFSASKYANPSSWYREGVAAKKASDRSRKIVAEFVHAHPDEIIFTSGGTESNTLAIRGAFHAFTKTRKAGDEKPHLVISSIEHSSIMELAKVLERQGCEVTRVGVDKEGRIDLDELKQSLRPSTFLVSVMSVNNEIGTIQPIREIAKVIRNHRKQRQQMSSPQAAMLDLSYPLFHTDAAQAALYEELYVEKLGVDLMTLDGSKVYGPRGIGALYVRRGTPIEPIIHGGGQEMGMRSGTENLPGIAGFAKALEIAKVENGKGKMENTEALRRMMIVGLQGMRQDIKVNGPLDDTMRSPHILNISIPGIDNEFFIMQLDAGGVACSTKSSCLRDEKESYVLQAIGANSQESVRFSFGRWTTGRDIKRALKVISRLPNLRNST